MSDYMHDYTDHELHKLERKIRYEYAQAAKEVEKKANENFRRFHEKDEVKRKLVKEGKLKRKEYLEWRRKQLLVGARWKDFKNNLSKDLLLTNEKSRSIAEKFSYSAYANNFNFGIYEAETKSGVDTGFALYDRDTVEFLLRDNPDLLPPPGKETSLNIATGRAQLWEKQKIQSAALQGILQGESIPDIAKRLAKAVCDSNMAAAIRNARTMTTGAENAGRRAGHARAEQMGIHLEDVWIATLDGRTRHEHRLLDQQSVKVGEPFKVGRYELRYPGDPAGPPWLVYNCRCTIIGKLKGVDDDIDKIRHKSDLKGMSYEKWKASKPVYKRKKKKKKVK